MRPTCSSVHCGSQSMRKLAANRRSDLRYLLGGAEPVEPRHQRGVQACRDRRSRGWNGGGGGLPRVSLSASNTAFVISYSGTPSVRSIMFCLMLSGMGLLPVTPSIMAAISRSPSRLSMRAVT